MGEYPAKLSSLYAGLSSELEGTQQLILVAPKRALVRRFYPPLLLLICLTSMCPQRRPGEDPEFDTLTGLEPLFRAFVSKIAFLCCTEIGGGAILACAVLQLPDYIQYVIGFNERSPARREEIQVSISSILRMFSTIPPDHSAERETLRRQALHASLELCKGRVIGYLRSLKGHLQQCIEACERENTPESKTTRNKMSQILGLLQACFDTCKSKPVDCLAVCDLIASLNDFFRCHIFVDVRRRLAREDNMMSTAYWSDFVHVAGRLLTYKRAVSLMDTVATIWPQLFSGFQVCTIQSSSAVPGVLPTNPWTAAEIMNGMSSDESLLSLFTAQLGSLSVHDIDTKVSELRRHAPKPTVHAEVLVHDWLEKTEGGIRPERFFNRWKFIGSSKPPCKLCSYFFDEYPTDVQVRPSHQNTYFAWRMPDVYMHQGDATDRKRMLVMESIKTRIRADVVRMLSERLADGRPHDSSAYISFWRGTVSDPRNRSVSLEETAQLLESSTVPTTEEPGATNRESAEGAVRLVDEKDEEEILFKGRSAVRKPRRHHPDQ